MRRFAKIFFWLCGLTALIGLVLWQAHPAGETSLGVQPPLETSAATRAPAQSAQELAQTARLFPWRTDLWEQAGQLAWQDGDAAAAIPYFTQAAQRNGLLPAGRLALGDAYRQSGDLNAAVEAWQIALQQGAPASQVYPRLLEAHRRLGDYQAAIADLQAMLEDEPDRADLHYQIGLLLAATQPEAALPHLQRAGDLDAQLARHASSLAQVIRVAAVKGDPAYSLVEAGRALGDLNEWELALHALKSATQARPDYAEAWAFLGEARQHLPLESAGQDGLEDLKRALALDPQLLSAHLLLGLYWQRQGDIPQALTILRQAAALYPDNPSLPAEIGRMLALQGDLEAAAQAYQQAIQLAPYDPLYYRLLAQFCLEYSYQLSQIGLPAARRSVMLAPNDPAALDTLGQALFKSGDIPGAKRLYNRAISLDVHYAPAYLHLGLVYLMENQPEKAQEMFSQTIALAPGTPTADHAQRLLENYFP